MSHLATWWRRVFGEPAPMEYSAMAHDDRSIEIPPDRQAVIDELARRQHAQANEITAETGHAYITSRGLAKSDGVAIRREREFWQRSGGHTK